MIILLFIFGLLVGSFLNVVIFRIEKKESFVGGRSHCLYCGQTLSWFENIPLVSFLMLRGKCRACQIPISWQYPAVECITAVLFAGSLFILNQYQDFVTQLTLGFLLLLTICFAILIAVYDFRFSLIPNVFLWGLNISTFLLLAYHWIFQVSSPNFFPPSIASAAYGALITGAFFFLLVFLSNETWMGWGDVWLGFWGGMLVGLEVAQLFITLSFSLGALVGLVFLYRKKKTLKTEIPFAPYILIAGLILFFSLQVAPEPIQFLSPWLPGTIK